MCEVEKKGRINKLALAMCTVLAAITRCEFAVAIRPPQMLIGVVFAIA